MPLLLPHLKNSFFPSEKEKEEVPDLETSTSELEGGDEETTAAVVETSDNTDTTIDDKTSASGGTTTAELGEKDTSSTSSTVSDVSSKASYEESAAGTVILTKPQRSDFGGRSDQAKISTSYDNV